MGNHPTAHGKMGNTQSAPTPREQHRLSKPRTNTSSSNLLALANQQAEPGSQLTSTKTLDIVETEVVVTSHSGESRSRQDARPRLRAHLFGSTIEIPRNEAVEDHTGRRCPIGELVSGVRDRLSRSGSFNSQSPNSRFPSARGSSTYLANSLGASRLSLVPESTVPDLEESTRLLEEIKAKASTDELAAFNHISSPVDESAPNDSVLSPIRRRSLMTPGIATRVPDDILRKPPPPERIQSQVDHDYYYNPCLSDSSPLARLAVLDLAEECRSLPIARTVTPTFLDYSHLGGLKLGTLHVTNGTASPTPSEHTFQLNTCQSFLESMQEEDYFTASNGHGSKDEDVRSILRDLHWHSERSVPVIDLPFPGNGRAGELSEVVGSAISVDTGIISSGSLSNKRGKLQADASLDDEIPTDSATSTSSKKQRPLSLFGMSNRSPDRASNIAQEYIFELPDSPFSYSESAVPDSPKLPATSKANEFDEDLLEDEGIGLSAQDHPSMIEWKFTVQDAESKHVQGGSREDALRILDGQPISTSEEEGRPTSSSRFSTEYAEITSSTNSQSGKPLSKADSGYSSNASLRSLKKNLALGNPIETRLDDLTSVVPVRQYVSRLREMPAPPSAEISTAPIVTVSTPARKSRGTRPSILGAPDAVTNSDHKDIPLPQTSSETTATLSSHQSASTQMLTSQRKLRKTRPLSQPSPVQYITVQGYRELSQSHIPPVPSDVAAKHAERLRQFPMLEHTFPSLQHTTLRDDSSSVSPIPIPVRFPSPANALEETTSLGNQLSQSAYAKRRSNPHPLPHCQSGSINWIKSERRSSRQRLSSQDDVLSTIADFGTMTESLGGSPYDIARSALDVESRNFSDHTLTHPQRMSNAMSRGKATVGMDEEAAARFAGIRSKTRSQSFSRSRTPSNGSFNDRGGIPGKTLRPKSMIVDAPPVPALPTTVQVEMNEARTTRLKSERPTTLTIPQAPDMVLSELSNGSTPKDGRPRAGELDKSWESTRRSWLQRRKSAGEGLLAHGQTFKSAEVILLADERKAAAPGQTSTAANQKIVASTKGLKAPGHRPTPHQQASTIPSQSLKPPGDRVAAAKSSFECMSGRYDGGLAYGYEPGYGLGGSAGTRNLLTGASRKSIDVSRGFGIDLSDVPIFVARTVDSSLG